MNGPCKTLVTVLCAAIMALSGVIFTTATIATGQELNSYAEQLQGSWTLVSMVNEQDGKKIEPFGSNPNGLFILTQDGRFSQIITRANLPKFKSDNRMKGTDKEYESIVQGSFASYGKYKIQSEKDHAVILTIDCSTFPNWINQEQKRIITINGDGLKSYNPTTTIGGTNYSIWKRSK